MNEIGGIALAVDLRSNWKGVRDQGMRSSCLACAGSDCHGSAQRLDDPLSIEDLFRHATNYMPGQNSSNGLTLSAFSQALRVDGQCLEAEWPYSPIQPDPWKSPEGVATRWHGAASFNSATGAGQDIIALLDARKPAIVAVDLVEGFHSVGGPDYVVQDEGERLGGHALIAAGHGVAPDGTQLMLVRNSWGFQWGFGGYAWLTLAYVKKYLIGYSEIEVI